MLAYLWFRLPETHRGEPLHGPVFAGFASLVRAPAFLGFALQSGFAMAAFMAFTTASPTISRRRSGSAPRGSAST
jgi:hypothetical protein